MGLCICTLLFIEFSSLIVSELVTNFLNVRILEASLGYLGMEIKRKRNNRKSLLGFKEKETTGKQLRDSSQRFDQKALI